MAPGVLAAAAAPVGQPDFHCGFGDVTCSVNQGIAEFFYSGAINMAHFMADSIKVAFDATTPGSADWATAQGQFAFWVQVMLPIVMAIAIVQIGIAAILQDWTRLRRVVLGAMLGLPLSGVCVWLMQQASTVTDSITESILATVQGSGGASMASAIGNMFGLSLYADQTGASFATQGTKINSGGFLGSVVSGATAESSVGSWLLVAIMVGIMWLASLFLFAAMALRLFGLVVLAALAPVGLMMAGQPKLAVWGERWAAVTVGFLAAKPLAAGVIAVAVSLAGQDGSLVGIVVGTVGLFVAAFSPLWAVKFMGFASAETASALSHRPGIRESASRVRTASAPARGLGRLASRKG